MSKIFKIRKGLNINLVGQAEHFIGDDFKSKLYTLRPTDFAGITPKLILNEGDSVKRGEVVFFDKYQPDIKFTSPVNGKISKIVRGDKRKLLEVVIEANVDDNTVSFGEKIKSNNPEEIKEVMLESGAWPFFKQRPYGVIANPEDKPRDIFISFFDSAPLAADHDFILKDKKAEINIAIKKIALLTDGKVYLNFAKKSSLAELIENNTSVEINYFDGPHPAGLVGTHINKIKPINKSEVIWTLAAADLVTIGHLFITGEFLPERLFALAGSEVRKPRYFKAIAGADLSELLKREIVSENVRIISGNVLTGTDISLNPALGFYDYTVSVIPEGNKFEMFGWALPGFNKFSTSTTFASSLIPRKKFVIDTNFHGGHRSLVVTGEYEKVCPLDIYPQLLLKAIITVDIDKMEQLGIYEVIEEDLALCEFVCTSKTEIQQILREGLDLVRKEMS
jgi:Na+-transporting NADH:ubiquinone oxidoreductase subunit A